MDAALDECLRVVADSHRREILNQLRVSPDGKTTRDELIDVLLRAASDSEVDQRRRRKQLTIQLHHTHLPKLANYGVVDYDDDSGTVEYQPDDRMEAVLDSLPEERTYAISDSDL
jgi:hypothetical protein